MTQKNIPRSPLRSQTSVGAWERENPWRGAWPAKPPKMGAPTPPPLAPPSPRAKSPSSQPSVAAAAVAEKAVQKVKPTEVFCTACKKKDQIARLKDRAAYASDSYKDVAGAGLPAGAKRLSLGDLEALGISKKMVDDPTSGFAAAVYKDAAGNYITAFRGTEILSGSDWWNNAKQALGFESDQYNSAMNLASKMKRVAAGEGKSLEFVGHSLGGGLATAAGMVTRSTTTTFNPAGLNPATVKRYGAEFDPKASYINNFIVEGEVLNDIQNPTTGSLGMSGLVGAAKGLLTGGPVGAVVGGLQSVLTKWGIGSLLPDPAGASEFLPKSGLVQRVPVVGGLLGHMMSSVDGGLNKMQAANDKLLAGGSCADCN